MSKAKRKERIFVDWMRNERGATAIAPFSLGAREGAPVAVPVDWTDLGRMTSAAAFDINTARERSWSDLDLPKPLGLSQHRIAALERMSTCFDAT